MFMALNYVSLTNAMATSYAWPLILSPLAVLLLRLEFQYLASLDIDLDLSATGFDLPEIDVLVQGVGANTDTGYDAADEVPAVEARAITRSGDVWQVGRHRLVCGDATDPAVYQLLLGGERAQMVFTDPPYNVPVDGHVGGLGKTRHREFAMAAGEMDPAAFARFLTTVFCNLAAPIPRTDRCTSNAWTGGICRRSWPRGPLPMAN